MSSIREINTECRQLHLTARQVLLCRAVFSALGLLLLVAAGFKAYQAYSELPSPNPLGVLALICFEICFGAWLIAGARTSWTWRVSVATFTVFACVSAYRILIGASSCGCFGKVEVNPWITLGIDVFALILLYECRTGVEKAAGVIVHRAFPRVAFLALPLLLLAAAAAIYGPTRFVPLDSGKSAAGRLVILEPEAWVGERWPLLQESGLENRLAAGEWDVVLFRHDCHLCHDVMAELEFVLASKDAEQKVALIGIDTEAADAQVARLQERGCLVGHLPQDRSWFTTTPLRVRLNDGVCVSAKVVENWN